MRKMFKCEDGTVFPIDEVVSITEDLDYRDFQGGRVTFPITWDEEEDVKRVFPKFFRKHLDRFPYEEEWLVKLFRHLFVKLSGGSVRESDELKKIEIEGKINSDMMSDLYGVLGSRVHNGWARRQWNVKIKHRHENVKIYGKDYKKLCEMMGQKVDEDSFRHPSSSIYVLDEESAL